jgi:hypothetical protein
MVWSIAHTVIEASVLLLLLLQLDTVVSLALPLLLCELPAPLTRSLVLSVLLLLRRLLLLLWLLCKRLLLVERRAPGVAAHCTAAAAAAAACTSWLVQDRGDILALVSVGGANDHCVGSLQEEQQ